MFYSADYAALFDDTKPLDLSAKSRFKSIFSLEGSYLKMESFPETKSSLLEESIYFPSLQTDNCQACALFNASPLSTFHDLNLPISILKSSLTQGGPTPSFLAPTGPFSQLLQQLNTFPSENEPNSLFDGPNSQTVSSLYWKAEQGANQVMMEPSAAMVDAAPPIKQLQELCFQTPKSAAFGCTFTSTPFAASREFPSKSSSGEGYPCSSGSCHRGPFRTKQKLLQHTRIHLGIRPYECTWPGCSHGCTQKSNLTKHIRRKHFRLPDTLKKQREEGIPDSRDPNEFTKVNGFLLAQKLTPLQEERQLKALPGLVHSTTGESY